MQGFPRHCESSLAWMGYCWTSHRRRMRGCWPSRPTLLLARSLNTMSHALRRPSTPCITMQPRMMPGPQNPPQQRKVSGRKQGHRCSLLLHWQSCWHAWQTHSIQMGQL
jgi:hypothetical protein